MATCYNTAQKSSKSISWYFCLWRNWVDNTFFSAVSLKYSSSSPKSMNRSLWLCRWLNCSKTIESLVLIAVFTSIKIIFICALLCVSKPSRALIKKGTKCRRSELKRNMVSGIRFDETETDIGTRSPIHFVVSVSSYVSSFKSRKIRNQKQPSF